MEEDDVQGSDFRSHGIESYTSDVNVLSIECHNGSSGHSTYTVTSDERDDVPFYSVIYGKPMYAQRRKSAKSFMNEANITVKTVNTIEIEKTPRYLVTSNPSANIGFEQPFSETPRILKLEQNFKFPKEFVVTEMGNGLIESKETYTQTSKTMLQPVNENGELPLPKDIIKQDFESQTSGIIFDCCGGIPLPPAIQENISNTLADQHSFYLLRSAFGQKYRDHVDQTDTNIKVAAASRGPYVLLNVNNERDVTNEIFRQSNFTNNEVGRSNSFLNIRLNKNDTECGDCDPEPRENQSERNEFRMTLTKTLGPPLGVVFRNETALDQFQIDTAMDKYKQVLSDSSPRTSNDPAAVGEPIGIIYDDLTESDKIYNLNEKSIKILKNMNINSARSVNQTQEQTKLAVKLNEVKLPFIAINSDGCQTTGDHLLSNRSRCTPRPFYILEENCVRTLDDNIQNNKCDQISERDRTKTINYDSYLNSPFSTPKKTKCKGTPHKGHKLSLPPIKIKKGSTPTESAESKYKSQKGQDDLPLEYPETIPSDVPPSVKNRIKILKLESHRMKLLNKFETVQPKRLVSVRSLRYKPIKADQCRSKKTTVNQSATNSRSAIFTQKEDDNPTDNSKDGLESFNNLLAQLKDDNWEIMLEGLTSAGDVIAASTWRTNNALVTKVLREIHTLVKSPRLQVCRAACIAAGQIFKINANVKRPEFNELVTLLLLRTCNSNKFVRTAANRALDDMVANVEDQHAIRALCSRGVDHKSPLVRCTTARLLVCSCVLGVANSTSIDGIIGGGRLLSEHAPSPISVARKLLLNALSTFMVDKDLDTRKFAERLYKMIRPHPNFKAYFLTDVDMDLATNLMKKFDATLIMRKDF